MAHIDLKPPNVLMQSTDPDAPIMCKLTDFGVSKEMRVPIFGRFVDNPIWLAPEVLRMLPYTEKVDTYAFGKNFIF